MMRHVPNSARNAALLILTTAAAVFLVAGPATADPVGDYTYTVSGTSATIMGYSGLATVVDIPHTITDADGTYTVTAIGGAAFRQKGLTSVTIPDTVTFIGDSAFRGNALTSIALPDSVVAIDTYAFYNNNLTSVSVPGSVTSIGNNAFRGNVLTTVSLSDSLTTIGNNTFADNALTSVTIPRSVTSLGNGTFAGNPLASAILAGAAPTTVTAAGATGSLGTGTALTVYYYAGASGFSSPWNGYTARAISSAESDLAITPTGPVLAGTAPYTLTATVHDDTHAPVAGVPVTFTVPAGITASAAECTTAVDGTCLITVASATAAAYTVTATVGADPRVLSRSIVFTAPDTASGDGSGTAATGTDDPALASTGTNTAVPLTLAGSLLLVGLTLFTVALIRRSTRTR